MGSVGTKSGVGSRGLGSRKYLRWVWRGYLSGWLRHGRGLFGVRQRNRGPLSGFDDQPHGVENGALARRNTDHFGLRTTEFARFAPSGHTNPLAIVSVVPVITLIGLADKNYTHGMYHLVRVNREPAN